MYTSVNIEVVKKMKNVEEMLSVLKNSGFDAYDYSMFCVGEPFNCILEDDYIEKANTIRKIADDLGIACNQTHAPFPSWAIGDEAYNERMFVQIIRAIEITGILGGTICVVHPCNDATPEQNAEFYTRLLPYAKAHGVKIGVENMWNWENGCAAPAACYNVENYLRHMELLDKEWFVANLDLGHADMFNHCGITAVDMVYALKDRLGGLHIHDNDCFNDSHAIPFTMKMPIKDIFNALKEVNYQGDITLEIAPYSNLPVELYPSVMRFSADIARYLRELLKD